MTASPNRSRICGQDRDFRRHRRLETERGQVTLQMTHPHIDEYDGRCGGEGMGERHKEGGIERRERGREDDRKRKKERKKGQERKCALGSWAHAVRFAQTHPPTETPARIKPRSWDHRPRRALATSTAPRSGVEASGVLQPCTRTNTLETQGGGGGEEKNKNKKKKKKGKTRGRVGKDDGSAVGSDVCWR